MCLIRDDKTTEKFRIKHKNKDKIVVWKIYNVSSCHTKLSPPYAYRYDVSYHECVVRRDQDVIRSNRTSIETDHKDSFSEVHRGIHVFLTRRDARDYITQWFECSEAKVFRCTSELKDLVAVGRDTNDNDGAVFMEIHMSKEDFDKGMKGRN